METYAYVIFSLLFCVSNGQDASQPVSHQLYKDLMKDYQPQVLPVYSNDEAVEVNFGISLAAILNVDVVNKKLVINIWQNYLWKDRRLSWEEEKYNGVKSIRIPEKDLWAPDIRLYNSLANPRVFTTDVVVYADGTCSYVPVEEVTTACQSDLTYFPYDTQYCTLKYGSWTYDGSKVNLTTMYDNIDVNMYQPNAGWELVSVPAKRNVVKYECCPEPYVDITFTIQIKRRGSSYLFEFVTPAVVLSLLIPFLFLLPSDSTARFALGAGMLVSIMLMMTLLSNVIPRELIARPLLGTYYDMMFILVSLALALSALITNIASKSKEPTPPPNVLKTILLNVFGRILCVTYDRKYGVPSANEAESGGKGNADNQTRAAEGAAYEWRLMAKALDRLFLIIFFAIVIIGSLAVLPK